MLVPLRTNMRECELMKLLTNFIHDKLMKKRFQLLVLSVLCAAFAYAQLEEPAEGVYRIVNVAYDAVLVENYETNTLHCTPYRVDDDFSQLWILKKDGDRFSFQNAYTAAYIQTGNDQQEVPYWTGATADAFDVTLSGSNDGYNIFDPNLDEKGLHSKGAEGNVVRWVGCAASEWTFTKVEVSEEAMELAQAEYAEILAEKTAFEKAYASILQDCAENQAKYAEMLYKVFVDSACTKLTATYAAMDVDEIRAALADSLPEALINAAVKVRNDDWYEVNEKEDKAPWDSDYAKKFRVQMIEPYSIAGEITEWIGHQGHSNMDNPTGLYANKLDVFYIMVEGEIKDGAELWATWIQGHSKMPNYNNGYSNGIRLKQGLNIIPFRDNGCALYFNYLVHTYNKNTKKFTNKLSNYDDLKIHVEGGYINGYYNVVGDALYKGDNDNDWKYYEERANLENITILGRYEVLQFELNDVVHTEFKDGKAETWEHRGLRALFPEELPEVMPNSPAYKGPNHRINGIVEAWDRIFLAEKMALGVASKAEVDSMNKLFPSYDAEWKKKGEIFTSDSTLLAFCDSLNNRDGDYGEYYNHHGLAFGTRTGYMYGSWDHSGYHINTTPSIMTAIATEAGPTWGPAHEIGHQHQALFTLNGEMEVTNNFFANVAAWYMGMGTSRVNGTEGNLAHVYDNFREGNFLFGNNIWALTQRYYRLWLYYHRAGNNTQFYPRLFELLRKSPMERSYGNGTGEYYDDKKGWQTASCQLTKGAKSYLHFYKLCCEAAQEDLTEFFRAYGYFVPVDGTFVGDYTNSKYYLTQKEIDAAIAEVKKKGYPVNNLPLFINDCTPDKTYGHDGKTQRKYWDDDPYANWGAGYYPTSMGENAEVGCYVDFLAKDSITGKYVYSLSNLTMHIEGGDNAVGFAVYAKEDGAILAFSNHHKFKITKETEQMLRAAKAEIYAIGADGVDVPIINRALLGTPEEMLAKLKEALKVAKGYLEKTDTTGTKVGYLIPDSIVDYTTLVEKVEYVIANEDTTEYKYGEWYVNLDVFNANVLMDVSLRVPLTPDCFYAVTSVNNNVYQMGMVSGGGLNTVNKYTDATQWKVAPVMTKDYMGNLVPVEGSYYLRNREFGKYVSKVEDTQRVLAEKLDVTDEAVVKVKFEPEAPGVFYIQPIDNEGLYFYNSKSSSGYRVYAGNITDNKAKWELCLVDDLLSLPDTITNDQMMLYSFQRADNGEYAYHTTARGVKGRIASGDQDKKDDLVEVNDPNYWFYFGAGSEAGKYTVHSYATGLSLSLSKGYVYANKEADKALDYSIELNEGSTALIVSSEQGNWYLGGSNMMLNDKLNTAWKLQRMYTVDLEMGQSEATIEKGKTATLSATVTPAGGAIAWSTSDKAIATVDENGKVKGIAEGTATITATVGLMTATCEVIVTEPTSIEEAVAAGLNIQTEGGVIAIEGLDNGTEVSVYNVAGSLIGATTASNGTATIDANLAKGSTVIVKIGTAYAKLTVK